MTQEELEAGNQGWSESAVRVLKERYFLKDDEGNLIENANLLCKRVAKAVAEAERKWGGQEAVDHWADEFYEMLSTRKFLPNTPALMNAGTGNGQSFSACFVLGIPDNLAGIFDTIKHAALIHKASGGTGFDFSSLRPEGSMVGSTQGVSSGPVSFLKVFNAATEQIKAGGRRRGANLAALRCDHPDLFKFIGCKITDPVTGLRDITNFNISVTATDAFIQAVKEGADYELIDPHTKKVTTKVNAKEVFDKICETAWICGDPGFLFIDKINNSRCNPIPELETIATSNPCGEINMGDNDACNLGSVNLSKFIYSYNGKNNLDFNKLYEYCKKATRFLDNIVETSPFPLPQITEKVHSLRRLGLGVMGWADILFKLRIPYESTEARELADKVMRTIQIASEEQSELLALERGVFPLYHRSIYRDGPPRRNGQLTAQAPTGCQVASTLIQTDQGILRLDELGDVLGEEWQPLNNLKVDQEDASQQATRFFVKGIAITKRIHLASGSIMECTPNHRYRVFSGVDYVWRRADELGPMDLLAIRIGGYSKATEPDLVNVSPQGTMGRREKSYDFPSIMSPDLAFFVGLYIGNGSVHTGGLRIHFGETLLEKIDLTVNLVRSLFGIECKLDTSRGCTSININSRSLVRWMKENSLCKKSSIMARIPEIIRRSSAESLRSFIEGLYTADGSHSKNSRYIDTSSYKLAQELLVCLRSLGQNARVATASNTKGRISDKDHYRIYFKLSGSTTATENQNAHGIRKAYREVTKIARSTAPEIFWDEVLKIEDGEALTYDIEVPVNNTYLANNVVSHNTISILANCSSGIEPLFALAYQHVVNRGKPTERILNIVNEVFKEIAIEENFWSESLEQYIAETGSLKGFNRYLEENNIPDVEVPKWSEEVFAIANEISVEGHIDMQSSWQAHIDNACSKSVNMPNSATVEDIKNAYLRAYDKGCKGITIFRDGCLSTGQVLNVGTAKKEAKETPTTAYITEEPGSISVSIAHDTENSVNVSGTILNPGESATFTKTGNDQEWTATVPDLKANVNVHLPGFRALTPEDLPSPSFDRDLEPHIASDGTVSYQPSSRWEDYGTSEEHTKWVANDEKLRKEYEEASKEEAKISMTTLRESPSVVQGFTSTITAPEGSTHVTVNSDNHGPLEVFINIGKAGSDIAALSEAMGRLISLCLRLPSAMSPEERLGLISGQLRGIGGSKHSGFGIKKVLSLPDAVAKVLEGYAENHVQEKTRVIGNSGTLVFDEGELADTAEEFEGIEVDPTKITRPSWESIKASRNAQDVKKEFVWEWDFKDNESVVTQTLNNLEPSHDTLGLPNVQVNNDIAPGLGQSPKIVTNIVKRANTGAACDSCGNFTLIREEGCSKCYGCGFSKC